uniref:Uncharacterized protein n=1 Tax=Opuntia streptacantha TaxID=393608 RepID=A0A7C9EIR7_OPUST
MKQAMENKRTSKKNHTNSPRRKRRSHSRKTLSNCLINFAEARREVAKALRRHRSTITTTAQYGYRMGRGLSCPIIDNMRSFSKSPSLPASDGNCCYPLVKAHEQGVAGPIWSTTGASIVCGPTSILEALEFDEWRITHDETSFAASHNWWVGFLESLDGKNHQEDSHEEPNLDDRARILGQVHDLNFEMGEATCSSSSSIDGGLESSNPIDEMLVYDVLNIS